MQTKGKVKMIITLNINGIDREFEQTEDGRLTTAAPKTNL